MTGTLSWRRLEVLLESLPRDSATARAVLGDDAIWGTDEQLLAMAIDALHVANWQRSGGKGRRPRRLPRPGVSQDRRVGATDQSPEQVRSYLAQFRPPQEAGASPSN